MNAFEDRYAVVLLPDNQPLARWLRPSEAAAYVETFNRLMHKRNQAAMIREAPAPPQFTSSFPPDEPST